MPSDQPNITVEDMVQKNFIKYPDSSIHESKSLKNYTKLPANDQQNLNKMRQAEQNAVRRKETVLKFSENMQNPSESLELKKSDRFDSLESYNSPSRSLGMRNKIKSVWTEQERVYSDKPISIGTIQGENRFPSYKSPTLMKVEINDVSNKERSPDDIPRVEEIWTK